MGLERVLKTHCNWERKQEKNFHLQEVQEYILVSYSLAKDRSMEKSFVPRLENTIST